MKGNRIIGLRAGGVPQIRLFADCGISVGDLVRVTQWKKGVATIKKITGRKKFDLPTEVDGVMIVDHRVYEINRGPAVRLIKDFGFGAGSATVDQEGGEATITQDAF